jgi:glycosyl transferase family 92
MTYELSVCAIAKDETPYLEEWINFHRAVGVEHFFIYDNDSAIPIKQTLAKYIDAGMVDVIKFSGKGVQHVAYNHFFAANGNRSKWVIVCDIDEFFVPKEKDTIQEVLADYEDYGGLNVSWRIFGSNNHITMPDGYVVENYTMASPRQWYENSHTKVCVRSDRVLQWGSNPHFALYKGKYHAVSEDYKLLTNAWTPHCANKIQCNHYCFKSLDEAQRKVAKPRADTADPNMKGKSIDDYYRFEKECTIEDRCALRFVEKMKGLYL